MKTIKAALFDLDGTLVDSETQYSAFWGMMGKKYFPEITDFSSRVKGTTLRAILDTYFPDKEMQAIVPGMIDDYESKMEFPPIAGAAEFIKDLKANGVKCAVVTSSDKKKMGHVYNKEKEFMQLFDAVLTAEDFSASKPDPDCYLKAAKKLGVAIDECVVFEDAFNGINAGRNAGMPVIGLATTNKREQIETLCVHVIDNYIGFNYDAVVAILNREQ